MVVLNKSAGIAESAPEAVSIELYGDVRKNGVEGMYFLCHFPKSSERLSKVRRNQVVSVRGRISAYVHHPRSPYIIVENCAFE